MFAKDSTAIPPEVGAVSVKTYSLYDVETVKDIADKDVQIPVLKGAYTEAFIQDQINALTFQIGEWQKKLDAINLLEPK
jgi:uncharacterized protein YqkB